MTTPVHNDKVRVKTSAPDDSQKAVAASPKCSRKTAPDIWARLRSYEWNFDAMNCDSGEVTANRQDFERVPGIKLANS